MLHLWDVFLAFEVFLVDLHSVVNSFVPLRTLFLFSIISVNMIVSGCR